MHAGALRKDRPRINADERRLFFALLVVRGDKTTTEILALPE